MDILLPFKRWFDEAGQRDPHKPWRWNLRMCEGMVFAAWWQCVLRSRGRVRIDLIHVVLAATALAPIHSLLGWLQRLICYFRIRSVQLKPEDPIFIIGHWRSGTTLIHEYLSCDPRFASPTTLQCFTPADFMLVGPICKSILSIFLPKKRPMDQMDLGWDTPQEDEFAMANLGAGSIYLECTLPDSGPIFHETLEMDLMSESRRRRWFQLFDRFLKHVALSHRCEKLILKSPQHTFRIRHLLKNYPNAQFVHISRDPDGVLRSTRHLWQTLYSHQGLQHQETSQEQKRINDFFDRMYRAYFSDRKLLGREKLVEIRYEDLIVDPLKTIAQIYDQLDLGEFSRVMPILQQALSEKKDYKTNDFYSGADEPFPKPQAFKQYSSFFGYAAS